MEQSENYYFYRLPMSSERGKEISKLIENIKEAIDGADHLMKELGAVRRTESPDAIYPGLGIGSLLFLHPQSGKKYIYIGKNGDKDEYIPNINEPKGKEIAIRIRALPYISSDMFRNAFGLSKDKDRTPAWFIHKEILYVRSSYKMKKEYIAINEAEFEYYKEEE